MDDGNREAEIERLRLEQEEDKAGPKKEVSGWEEARQTRAQSTSRSALTGADYKARKAGDRAPRIPTALEVPLDYSKAVTPVRSEREPGWALGPLPAEPVGGKRRKAIALSDPSGCWPPGSEPQSATVRASLRIQESYKHEGRSESDALTRAMSDERAEKDSPERARWDLELGKAEYEQRTALAIWRDINEEFGLLAGVAVPTTQKVSDRMIKALRQAYETLRGVRPEDTWQLYLIKSLRIAKVVAVEEKQGYPLYAGTVDEGTGTVTLDKREWAKPEAILAKVREACDEAQFEQPPGWLDGPVVEWLLDKLSPGGGGGSSGKFGEERLQELLSNPSKLADRIEDSGRESGEERAAGAGTPRQRDFYGGSQLDQDLLDLKVDMRELADEVRRRARIR